MAVMIHYMLAMSGAKACHEYHNESAIVINGTVESSLAANVTDAGCYQMMMIVNGLSLRNLLLFIFCTPCQVRLDW